MNWHQKVFSNSSLLRGAVLSLSLPASFASSQTSPIVLQEHPLRIGSMETANVYHEGTLGLSIGWIQTDPRQGTGTGNQLYFGGGSYALSDRFTLGFDASQYEDPTLGTIGGVRPPIKMNTFATWGKYQLYSGSRLSVSALASLESIVHLRSDLWGGDTRNQLIGSLKAPVSYELSDSVALHVTPSFTMLPESLNGTPYYGNIGSIGLGASWRASDRLGFAFAIDTPISGTNTISSSGSYTRAPVWTVSGRYNITPKAALDAYVTNGIGMTPATSVLTHWPEGDDVFAGLQLIYTPGANRPESYRGTPAPLTSFQTTLQQDGFTLGTPDTLEPGHLRTGLWAGSDGNLGVMLGFSPDRDGEIQVIFEQYSDNPSAPSNLVPTESPRYMFGPKLRFMDQNNGDLFSLSGRMLYGRQIDDNPGVGVFYVDASASYKTGRLSVLANPKIAAFGSNEIAGLGLGLTYAFTDSLQIVTEVTPVALDGHQATWAAGLRWNLPGHGFSVDAQATNAIGRYGIGSMIAQDDPRFAITLSKTFDGTGLKFY